MSQTVLQPKEIERPSENSRWMVVIYNNDTNSFEEVIGVLMRATGCDVEEASIETWEADHYGKAQVHFAGREECDDVAAVISSIGVRTEVSPEWP